MMTNKISSAEAKARLPEMIGRVAHGHERFIIQRRGKPMAALVPLEDLEAIESHDVRDKAQRGLLSLIGTWSELGDEGIDDFIKDIYESREAERGRPVILKP